MDPSQLTVPGWIREARELFPNEPMEVLTKHALQRYQMTELVTDPQILEKIEPSYDLLKAIITFRGMMKGPVLETARRVVRKVVDELSKKLAREVRQVLWGRVNRQMHTRHKSGRNLDVQRTIRANLKNFDLDRKQLVVDQLYFYARNSHHLPWHIIMMVDSSGSMADSVIHSAVMAGIFHGLPTVRVSLVTFDTSIVDLTDRVDDPMELLMNVQLGGGTDITRALQYCESLVQSPTRTIVIMVTDFFEGNSPAGVVRGVKRLREAGVKVLGLAALDADANPFYDRQLAQRCADAGAEIAALTPMGLATWLSKIIY
jgi:Mg-chelatase subunit ChlD